MWSDLLLQALIILLTVSVFLFAQNVPQKLFSKLRLLLTSGSDLQSKRHFVQGAQLLAQARSSPPSSDASSALAKRAESEADTAIALNPRDAAAHILKALALEMQGFRTSALDSLDAALSPLAVKSLSNSERGDALYKRAELRLGVSRGVDSVVEDLVESVRLKGDNAKAFGLLGECYENKGLEDEARKAYENAMKVEPDYKVVQEALRRLSSNTT